MNPQFLKLKPQFEKDLKKMLKADEGWSPTPYQDSEGVWTIGFGTNITRITREEGEALLTIRLNKIIQYDMPLWPQKAVAKLNEPRIMVVCNMDYNMGLSSVLGFEKMWQGIENEDWDKAADNMLWNDVPKNTIKTPYYRVVGKRAERLAAIMRSGEINNYVRAGQKETVTHKPEFRPDEITDEEHKMPCPKCHRQMKFIEGDGWICFHCK